MSGENLLKAGELMLKIKSDKISIRSNALDCLEYLSNLNNYKNLFPKEKINNWENLDIDTKIKILNSFFYTLLVLHFQNKILSLQLQQQMPPEIYQQHLIQLHSQ